MDENAIAEKTLQNTAMGGAVRKDALEKATALKNALSNAIVTDRDDVLKQTEAVTESVIALTVPLYYVQ